MILYAIQFIAISVMHFGIFNQDQTPFLLGTHELRYTSHAVVPINNVDNKCTSNKANTLILLADYTNKSSITDPTLFDFSETRVYQYTEKIYISTSWTLAFIFLLSTLFHAAAVVARQYNADPMRLIDYMEYSVTSALHVIIIAINIGISEVTPIICIAGVYLGTIMFSMCYEILHYMEENFTSEDIIEDKGFLIFDKTNIHRFTFYCKFIIICLALGPIYVQYEEMEICSERSVPMFIKTSLITHVILFAVYSLIQISFTEGRDYVMYIFSLICNTVIAWSLISANIASII
jgi:hypothetical protein